MAEKKFFVDINLQGNKLANAVVGANSSMTSEGSFQYNNGRLEYYNGTTVEEIANLSDISAVTGGLIFQGGYDADANTPVITDGNALKGFFWAVTVAGSFLGEAVQVGDSIVAKVDEAGATKSDWLILQGNVVIATDSVDGISRLATQTEANDGTEGGAVVITPATLQGKIDAQITPEISNKLPLAGGTMSGNLNMGNNTIDDVNNIRINAAPIDGKDATRKSYVDAQDELKLSLTGGTMEGAIDMGGNTISGVVNLIGQYVVIDGIEGNTTGTVEFVSDELDFLNNGKVTNLPAPTANGDAANKQYVDGAASTAQANAEGYADSLAPNYDAAGSAAQALTDANAYSDSLAPNYDPAGSASTAESNANAYTDTAIENNSYRIQIQFADWTLNGSQYEFEVTHNITSTSFPVVTFTDENETTVEAIYQALSGTAIKVIVNNRPLVLGVSLGAANPRI